MPASVISSKGQVTIPLSVRKKLGLDVGDRVDFVDLGNGRVGIMPAAEDIRALKGAVRRPAKPVSVASMRQAVRKRASKA